MTNSSVRVPRISQAAARELIEGFVLGDERFTTPGNYSIREYVRPETGERVYIGGDFSNW